MSDRMYMNKESLARALDCSKTTVDDLVRRKVIPEPVRLSSGFLRWRWLDVDATLRAHGVKPSAPDGVRNVRTGGPL